MFKMTLLLAGLCVGLCMPPTEAVAACGRGFHPLATIARGVGRVAVGAGKVALGVTRVALHPVESIRNRRASRHADYSATTQTPAGKWVRSCNGGSCATTFVPAAVATPPAKPDPMLIVSPIPPLPPMETEKEPPAPK